MAKELSLEELESKLQREEANLRKLVETSVSLELLTADGTTMTFETPGGVYCIVNEDEKKEEQETSQIYHEEPKIVTVEPTLFAKAKRQFVENVIIPAISKKADKIKARIEDLKSQIANYQPTDNGLGG